MVYDKYGEQTSLVSWSVGRGTINSPMAWTEYCILYFYGFKASDQKYLNTVVRLLVIAIMYSKYLSKTDKNRKFYYFIRNGRKRQVL